MRAFPLNLVVLSTLCFGGIRAGLAQVPVKLFTASDGQTDKGTARLVAAVKEQLATMPRYKLWQGGPSTFPKNGVLIDVQGIDVTDNDDDVIGSAVFLVCSTPAAHDGGAYRLLYRELIELRKGDEDVDEQAGDFLESLNAHLPSASATAQSRSSAKAKAKAKASPKHSHK